MPRQATIQRAVEVVGRSRSRQVRTRLKLRPAPPNTGVIFRRTDVGACVAASLEFACCCDGALVLGHAPTQVEAAEQLLAVVVAFGVTDLVVEVDGPEVPCLEASVGNYFELLRGAGIQAGPGIVPPLHVTAPLRVENAEGWLELRPARRLLLEVRERVEQKHLREKVLRFAVSPQATATQAEGVVGGQGGRGLLHQWAIQLLGCLALVGRPLCAEVTAVMPTPSLAVDGLRALVAVNPAHPC